MRRAHIPGLPQGTPATLTSISSFVELPLDAHATAYRRSVRASATSQIRNIISWRRPAARRRPKVYPAVAPRAPGTKTANVGSRGGARRTKEGHNHIRRPRHTRNNGVPTSSPVSTTGKKHLNKPASRTRSSAVNGLRVIPPCTWRTPAIHLLTICLPR